MPAEETPEGRAVAAAVAFLVDSLGTVRGLATRAREAGCLAAFAELVVDLLDAALTDVEGRREAP